MIPGPHYRKLTAIFVFLLFFQTAFSQAEPTAFGAFTPAEIALEECSFDKEADAIVLFDQAQSTYSDNYELITQRRIRMKILKPNGIERGNIRIHFYSGEHFETVRNISGVVLNTSGQTQVRTELDRKSIFEKKLNDYYSEIVFALPELKVGSLFEYRYESVMQHYGGLREWVFQRAIPVLLSAYDLTIVPNAEFTYSVYKSPFMPISAKATSAMAAFIFKWKILPACATKLL